MPVSDIIKIDVTPIQGLELHHTKVLGDPRGLLLELIPEGMNNPVLAHGLRNLYVSLATGKHIGRAAHFHFRNHEIFFTLTGTALWFFHDFREDSPTFGQSYACVLGADRPVEPVPDPVFVISEQQMVRAVVPVGVYHGYWPLTDSSVIVVCAASAPYDDTDYDRRPPSEVPGCRERLTPYGITI